MAEDGRLAGKKPYSRRPVTSGSVEEINRILDAIEKGFDDVQSQINALSPTKSAATVISIGPLVAGSRRVTFSNLARLNTFWFADTPGGAVGTPPSTVVISVGLLFKEDVTGAAYRVISDKGVVSFSVANSSTTYLYNQDTYVELTF